MFYVQASYNAPVTPESVQDPAAKSNGLRVVFKQ